MVTGYTSDVQHDPHSEQLSQSGMSLLKFKGRDQLNTIERDITSYLFNFCLAYVVWNKDTSFWH